MSAPSAVEILARAIERGSDVLLTDEETAKFLQVSSDELRKMRGKLFALGARCLELPSQSENTKRRRLRWSRNSLLAMARGINDPDPAVAGGGQS